MITVKELKEILSHLPDDASICKPLEGNGCSNLHKIRYLPEYNILFMTDELFWNHNGQGFDMTVPRKFVDDINDPLLESRLWLRIREAIKFGKSIVDSANDRKMHKIKGVMCILGNPHRYVVDVYVDGRLLNVQHEVPLRTYDVFDFDWESIKEAT